MFKLYLSMPGYIFWPSLTIGVKVLLIASELQLKTSRWNA